MTRAAATAGQPELKRRPVGSRVSIHGADLHDCLESFLILIHNRSEVVGEYREVVVYILQSYDQGSSSGLRWGPCNGGKMSNVRVLGKCANGRHWYVYIVYLCSR